MIWWQVLLIALGTLLVGGIIGFFVSRYFFQRYLRKHPPINENMVRAMMSQMGRTPSEKQVRAVMRSVEQNKA